MTAQIKKVGNYFIDLSKWLGQGQYGKVYLSWEATDLTLSPSSHKDGSLSEPRPSGLTASTNKSN